MRGYEWSDNANYAYCVQAHLGRETGPSFLEKSLHYPLILLQLRRPLKINGNILYTTDFSSLLSINTNIPDCVYQQ